MNKVYELRLETAMEDRYTTFVVAFGTLEEAVTLLDVFRRYGYKASSTVDNVPAEWSTFPGYNSDSWRQLEETLESGEDLEIYLTPDGSESCEIYAYRICTIVEKEGSVPSGYRFHAEGGGMPSLMFPRVLEVLVAPISNRRSA